MTFAERSVVLSMRTGETDTSVLSDALNAAAAKIWEKMLPFKPPDADDIPEKYQAAQIEIAAYLWAKRGAEGETRHNENGVDRTYESASVPDSMLKGIIPFCGVVSGRDIG